MEDLSKRVPGASEVIEELGTWPSFHDAEIIELHLVRGGASTLTINLAPSIPGLEKGIVRFTFHDVRGLDLQEFNRQNVIGRLSLDSEADGIVINMAPCYGLNGQITAARIEVELLAEP